MLKSKLKLWLSYLDRERFLDDLHNLGLVGVGVGCAGMFLDAYPDYEDGRFLLFTIIGLVSWIIGLVKRGSNL